MKEAALRAASTHGGGGRLRRPPLCVDSFMDECVAVAVAVAVTEALAEADQSIHDPSIRAGVPSGPKWSKKIENWLNLTLILQF